MTKALFLGMLDAHDPLYEILAARVCPQVGRPVFHVWRMSSSLVYRYREEKSRVTVIGKFFRPEDAHGERALRIKGEYENLLRVRNLGFDRFPHSVACPITREERIGLALVEEYADGRDLDHYLKRAVYRAEHRPLKEALGQLAHFLCLLHSKTAQESRVDLGFVGAYFQRILHRLLAKGVVPESEAPSLWTLMDRWLNSDCLRRAETVVVHGDATPTNFIFTEDGGITAIDLERMKDTDRAFDLGMVCGELKHAFFWRTGNPFAAEPFIHHFLRSYCDRFHHGEEGFVAITARIPFYMALTELRIARNLYLDRDYRKRLSREAFQCLKWGWKLHEEGAPV